jgi:hypothetical protein
MNDLTTSSQPIDIEAIRADAKRKWMADHHKSRDVLGWIEWSVPFWLVLIAAVLFALSAPHTAATFEQLVPNFGRFAPFGIEFGLLYAALERKKAAQTRVRVPRIVWAFEGLLFITAIIVNGAGSFMAVVASVGLSNLPFAAMWSGFGTFPATTQVALILVPIAALIIPLGTVIAGEGIASLIFERDTSRDSSEEEWETAQFEELRKAFFQALVQSGVKPTEAKRQAITLAGGFVEQSKHVFTLSQGQETAGDRPETKTERAKRLLRDNPTLGGLSLNVLESQTGIDRSVWHRVKHEVSSNGNGHVS